MSFSYYKQHDSMQCGITCLAMICKHYGKEFSIETLSRYCFATTEGVSLLGISEAANKLACIAFVAEFRWSHCGCGHRATEPEHHLPDPVRVADADRKPNGGGLHSPVDISIIAVVLAVVALGVWLFVEKD